MKPLTDVEIQAIINLPPFPDENSPIWGMLDWMRRMASEIKTHRAEQAARESGE